MAGAIAQYVRHAERFGVDQVFEAARRDLDVRDLGRLSLQLQRIDPKWRLLPRERQRLALDLIADGEPLARVCEMAQVSRTTLWRIRNAQSTDEIRLEPAFQSGAFVSTRLAPDNPPGGGDMEHIDSIWDEGFRCVEACPFSCGWTTDELMSEPELAAVEGGADRLWLHLRVEHGAHPEREEDAWDPDPEVGRWPTVLFADPNPLNLSEVEEPDG